MPLTEAGNKIKRKMHEEYGEKEGDRIFYSKENADKKFKHTVTGKGDLIFSFEDGEVIIQNDGEVIIKAEHEGHLVSSEGKKHLPTSSNGKPNHRLMGAAWAALHGGYRGNKYEGPNKSQAIAKLKRMYHSEGMKPPSGKAVMEDKTIKQNRSEYPANEEGFTTSMGPADLSKFAEASKKSSPLWWAVRLNKLPEAVKAKIVKSLNLSPAVTWWNERIETLTNHLGNEEDDKEDHTR